MPKYDFKDKKIFDNYQLPENRIELKKGMSRAEVNEYLLQQLYIIHISQDSYMIKEMRKEDLYEKLCSFGYHDKFMNLD